MGQKLERLSEKDEGSTENSECSERTAETRPSETTEPDKSRGQHDDLLTLSGFAVSGPVASACTVPQCGRPIRSLGQRGQSVDIPRKWVGGDTEGWSVTRTVEGSETALSPKETRHRKQGSAVAFTGTTAMEEKESECRYSKLGPDTLSRALINPRSPAPEEEFVVLERDDMWTTSDEEINIASGDRIKTKSPARRLEKDTLDIYGDDALPQPSTSRPEDAENYRGSTGKSKMLVEAHAGSSPPACYEGETGRHLAEVTGSRCRLKGESHTETTRRGDAERQQNTKEHSEEQMRAHMNEKHLSSQNNSRLGRRLRESTGDLENVLDEAVQLTRQQEAGGEGTFKSDWERRSEAAALSSRESPNVEKANADQSHQSQFADVVYRRAKGTVSSSDTKEDEQGLCNAANSHSQQLQDNPSFSSEPRHSMRLPGKTAALQRESEHVCVSPVITPPPCTFLLPTKDTSTAMQPQRSTVNSQAAPDSTQTTRDSKEESMPEEKPRVKGPPPPVPKKPKNPFIKLKTAQLMSTDVQRSGKGPWRSEERVKRRHTFDFTKALLSNTPTNQDMCSLWDEKGPYAAPSLARRLSVGPWEQLSLKHMDDQYGDMVDFDYCERVAKLSPDEEPQNLDMLQRRIFLERRSVFKSSPVAKKPPNPFASTEALHTSRVTSAKAEKRETDPELVSRVSNRNHPNRSSPEDVSSSCGVRDAGNVNEVGSYKPVAKIVRETNRMQKLQGQVKPVGDKVQVRLVTEPSPSVKVSQMKNTFDAPKKSKERPQPPEVQPPSKKGKMVQC